MIVLDANLLLYAYDTRSPFHKPAEKWIEDLFSGPETVGLPWQTIWAFLRIRTNPRLSERPTPAIEALSIINEWLSLPGILTLNPGPRHCALLERLVVECQATGPLVSDAVLAALCMEHGATLASCDRDFSRFTGLSWTNPLSAKT